jgi:DNA-binding transcriptional MerR regulator
MADMNEQTTGLLGIGAFSCLVRLSVRMLRYYDKQAVLIPAYTDPDTGYRYYAGDQIGDAVLVRSLRDVGFSVSAITAVVPQAHDPQILRRALQAHRGELLAESSLVRRRLADLAHLIDNLTDVPMTDITLTTIPATTILALRGVVPTYAEQGQLWDTFAPLAQRCDLPARPETGGSTFFDEGYQDNDVALEAWVPIGEPITVEAPLTCCQVPQYRAAVATMRGDYFGIAAASADLARYLAREGLVETGPLSHVYVVGREQTTNSADHLTEIRIPV